MAKAARSQHSRGGLRDRANAGHGQKTRRPQGCRGKNRLAALLLGHRALRPCSFVAPCHPAFSSATAPIVFFRQALRERALALGFGTVRPWVRLGPDFEGRDYRLTDVHGNLIKGILA